MTLMATVIGDVVASRQIADRNQLHSHLAELLDRINQQFAPVTPLRFTVGDEFQGAFATIESAVRATLHLRVGLLPVADLRHGLGWGEVTVLQEDPRVEDGPGWWSAREAIDAVHQAQEQRHSQWVRTSARGSDVATAVDALLPVLDRVVGELDDRGIAILQGLLAGRSQREIAERLAITPSAVSQRIRSTGLDAVVQTDNRLSAAVRE